MKRRNVLLVGILLLVCSGCLVGFDIKLYNRYVSSMKKNIITATLINKECDTEDMCIVTYKYKINKNEYEYTKEDKVPESNVEEKVKILGKEVYTGKVKLNKNISITLTYIGLCAFICIIIPIILFYKSFKKNEDVG